MTASSVKLAATEAHARIPVGIWAQWPLGARWSNEGMTRLLGFLIEGIALDRRYVFRVVLPDWIRKEAEADLRTLAAQLGSDFTLHSPVDHGVSATSMGELVSFANRYVDVDGWLSIFPNFSFAADLEKPLAVIFPDAIPKVFHEFSNLAWGHNGNHAVWEMYVRSLVHRADRIVTFSKHVRDEQLTRLFGIDPAKVVVVPHAAPDLAPALPFVENRTRTPKPPVSPARCFASIRRSGAGPILETIPSSRCRTLRSRRRIASPRISG